MRAVKGIVLAVMTLTLPVLIGCGGMTTKPYPEQPPLPGPTGVETPQDAALSKAVKERLSAEKAVNLSPVIVETRKGTVYLSGVVPSLDARERAVKISWQVPGVQTVLNHLQVAE
jgi:osmotically-inducible protein OsmY